MAPTVCLTGFRLAEAAQARILAATLKAAHPDWTLHAVIADAAPGDLPPAVLAPFDQVTEAAAIGIADFPGWIFAQDPDEASLAAALCLLPRLLAAGAERVVHLGTGMAVFHPLALDGAAFETASVLLAPMQIAPNEAAWAFRDNELMSLRQGVYNPSLLAVRNDETGRAFAAWLADTIEHPVPDPRIRDGGMARRFCALAPALFDHVQIIRDPGYAVGSWNINHRRLTFTPEGDLLANGVPVRCYQFSPPGSFADAMTERYADGNVEVYELVNWYRRAVAREALPQEAAHGWHYASFADGTLIPAVIRALWRSRDDLHAAFADPFAIGPGTFHAWLQREQPDLLPVR